VRYLDWWLRASNSRGHGTHSPFVYAFIENVLLDKERYPVYEQVERLRHELRQSTEKLEVLDLGAGSRIDNHQVRRVSEIVRSAAKPAKYGQLLYRTAKHFGCQQIMELGTSLGVTTAYLSAAAGEKGKVITLEGAPAIAERAKLNFQQLGLRNIEQVQGDFDEQLPLALSKMAQPDMVYIDGNHRLEPTLRYFEWFREHSGENVILVFDDIHWSRGMEEAWSKICKNPEVTCTIDLFFIGLVFFRRSFREKVDFMIRY
jgi:predicted O-methyltransferase YrrM